MNPDATSIFSNVHAHPNICKKAKPVFFKKVCVYILVTIILTCLMHKNLIQYEC